MIPAMTRRHAANPAHAGHPVDRMPSGLAMLVQCRQTDKRLATAACWIGVSCGRLVLVAGHFRRKLSSAFAADEGVCWIGVSCGRLVLAAGHFRRKLSSAFAGSPQMKARRGLPWFPVFVCVLFEAEELPAPLLPLCPSSATSSLFSRQPAESTPRAASACFSSRTDRRDASIGRAGAAVDAELVATRGFGGTTLASPPTGARLPPAGAAFAEPGVIMLPFALSPYPALGALVSLVLFAAFAV